MVRSLVAEHESFGKVVWELPEWLVEIIQQVDQTDCRASEEMVANLERQVTHFFILNAVMLRHPPATILLWPLMDGHLDQFREEAREVLSFFTDSR